MLLRQHGKYELEVKGRVLVCTTSDDWNEVAVKNLRLDAARLWQGFETGRWGLLVDARDWGAATPEAVLAWENGFEMEAIAAGAVGIAMVLPSNFHRVMIQALTRRLELHCDRHEGLDIDAAWQWMLARVEQAPS